MNRTLNLIFTLLLLVSCITVSAQKADSVEMGAGYGNDVFYSFANGEIKKSANTNWDLAFRTGSQTDGIFINSVSSSTSPRNTKLYLYPKSDISGWSSFDTAGWKTWLEYKNTDSSWEFGAFNRAQLGFPDFSWGIYNSVTHVITGDSLYLVEITNGANKVYKKLQIVDKNFGTYHFRYADVDGSNVVNDSIVGSNANAKLLDYYSLLDGSKPNREPDSTKYWDILFTRYHEFLPAPPPGDYYAVTGVFANKGVTVAEKKPIDISTFNVSSLIASDYKTDRHVIGSDWKVFDNINFKYNIEDSLAYFVKLKNGAVWKLVFTNFIPSPVGRSVFNKTQVTPGLSVNPVAPVASFGVFPNPASTTVSLVFENRDNSVKNNLQIFDINGKLVENHTLESAPGFYTSTLNIAHLPAGVYVVNIENGGHIISQKLVKE